MANLATAMMLAAVTWGMAVWPTRSHAYTTIDNAGRDVINIMPDKASFVTLPAADVENGNDTDHAGSVELSYEGDAGEDPPLAVSDASLTPHYTWDFGGMIPAGYVVRGVAVGDFDGTGTLRVAVAADNDMPDSFAGVVQVYTSTDGVLTHWSDITDIPQSSAGVDGGQLYITSGDVDTDGVDELLIGRTGGTAVKAGQLGVYEWGGSSFDRVWSSALLSGASSVATAVGDLDDDGVNELIIGEAYSGHQLRIIEHAGGNVYNEVYNIGPRTQRDYGQCHFATIGDTDYDGSNELYCDFTGSIPFSFYVLDYDGLDYEVIDSFQPADTSVFTGGGTIADLDGDGDNSLVAVWQADGGIRNTMVYEWSGLSFVNTWSSSNDTTGGSAVVGGQWLTDTRQHVAWWHDGGGMGDQVELFGESGASYGVTMAPTQGVLLPVVHDMDNNGTDELFVVTDDTTVVVFGVPLQEPPKASFDQATYSASEHDATVTLRLTRSGTLNETSVDLVVESGDAIAGEDYFLAASRVDLGADVSQIDVPVTLIDDNQAESDETLTLRIEPVDGSVVAGSIATTTLTIVDSQLPTGYDVWADLRREQWMSSDGVSLYAQAAQYDFGSLVQDGITSHWKLYDPANSYVDMDFSLAADVTDASVSISHMTQADPGGDDGYSPVDISLFGPAGTLTLADDYDVAIAHKASYTMEVDTWLLGDGVLGTGDYTLRVARQGGQSNYWLQAMGLRLYPQGQLRFSSSVYTCDEDAGRVVVPVVRTDAAEGEVSVQYTVSASSGAVPGDVDAASGEVTFRDGHHVATIVLPVFDDVLIEGDEYVHITLSSVTGGAVLANPSVATVQIVDNDSEPARVYYVDADATGADDGSSWGDAFTDLQDALAAADQYSLPCQIWIAGGVYYPDRGTGDRFATFSLADGVRVYGGFSGAETSRVQRSVYANPVVLCGDLANNDTIGGGNRGDNSLHVVTADGVRGHTLLDGVTIRSGQHEGITCDGTCADDEVVYYGGGGLWCRNASPTIVNCRFEDNGARDGGAVFADALSSPMFDRCYFVRNRADASTSTTGGGAIALWSGRMLVSNCIFDHNTSLRQGGAIHNWDGGMLVQHSTFVNNSADYGAAIATRQLIGDAGTVLTGSIVDRNVVGQAGQLYIDNGAFLAVEYSNVQYGRAAVALDSLHENRESWDDATVTSLVPLLTADGHLTAASGVRDLGAATTHDRLDIDGEVRTAAGAADLGADEFIDTDGDTLPDRWELRYAGSATALNANDDNDGDTLTNREEYELFGSNPLGAVVYVDDQYGDDSNDGLSAVQQGVGQGPVRTIQKGIDIAAAGQTVLVAAGTYSGAGNVDIAFSGKPVVLAGLGGSDAVTIDCQQQGRAFRFDSNETSSTGIYGFTIANGRATRGAGIYCYRAGPTLRDVVFTGNRVESSTTPLQYNLYSGEGFNFAQGKRTDSWLSGDMGYLDGQFITDGPGRRGIQNLGQVGMDQVDIIPADGFTTAAVDAQVGSTYVVLPVGSDQDYYGVFTVTAITGSYVSFSWVYVQAGNWPAQGDDLYCVDAALTMQACRYADPSGSLYTSGSTIHVVEALDMQAQKLLAGDSMFTGDGHIQLYAGGTFDITTAVVRCDILGNGTIQVASQGLLVAEDNALIDLRDTVGTDNGTIVCDGLLHMRGYARLQHTNVQVRRVQFEEHAIVSNNVITAEAGSPYGQFYIEESVDILDNDITADGDRYLDLEPDRYNGEVLGNTIDVNITEGQDNGRGGLLELRGLDTLCAQPPCDHGVFEVASVPESDQVSWTIDTLNINADARVTLTNRFDFGNGDQDEVLYVKNLILGPGSVLNTAFNRVYCEQLTKDQTASIVHEPLLGFSLNNIAFDDPDDFSARVRHNNDAQSGRLHVTRVTGNVLDPEGLMRMRNMVDDDPDSAGYGRVVNARAKGLFAKASESEMLIWFEYMFENPQDNVELVVSVSDTPVLLSADHPDRQDHYIEVDRIPAPPSGRWGTRDGGSMAVYSNTIHVPSSQMTFGRGLRIELELIGPEGTSVLINNWDPQIQCSSLACASTNGDQYTNYADFLKVLSEYGQLNRPVADGTNQGQCLDGAFSKDGYVDMVDLLAWDWYDFHSLPDLCTLGLADSSMEGERESLDEQMLLAAQQSWPQGLLVAGKKTGMLTEVLEGGVFSVADNGTITATHTVGQSRNSARLVVADADTIYQVNSNLGLIDLSTGQALIPPGAVSVGSHPRSDTPAMIYIGLQDDNGQPYARPLLDAAVGPHGDIYITPVVVVPDSDPAQAYAAAARIDPDNPAAIVCLYAYASDLLDCDQNVYDYPRDIEVDTCGHVYLTNTFHDNNGDIVWVFDADTGQLLVDSRGDVQPDGSIVPGNIELAGGVDAPIALHAARDGSRLWLGSARNDTAATTTTVYELSASDLSVLRTIEIVGMGHVTDITSDPATDTLYVVGFVIPSVPDDVTLFESFYQARLAIITSQATQVTATNIDTAELALPQSAVFIGPDPVCGDAQHPLPAGDLTGDCIVQWADFGIFAAQWQRTDCTSPHWCQGADMNSDGLVEWADFGLFAANWQVCTAPACP